MFNCHENIMQLSFCQKVNHVQSVVVVVKLLFCLINWSFIGLLFETVFTLVTQTKAETLDTTFLWVSIAPLGFPETKREMLCPSWHSIHMWPEHLFQIDIAIKNLECYKRHLLFFIAQTLLSKGYYIKLKPNVHWYQLMHFLGIVSMIFVLLVPRMKWPIKTSYLWFHW